MGKPKTGGDCFDANAEYLLYHMNPNDNPLLVHGIVRNSGDGKPMGHCWIEHGDEVICRANGNDLVLPKDLYYALGNINDENCFKYNHKEVLEWTGYTEHWGPWELDSPR